MTAADDHPLDLQATATDTLDAARAHPSGRTARTLTPGAGAALKQVLLGMTAGTILQDHRAPGPATVQVLLGRVTLTVGDDRTLLAPGNWTPIPEATHGVTAEEDSVVLLTVAPTPRAQPSG